MYKWFRKPKPDYSIPDIYKINGVLLGWDAMPHLSFEGGTYLPTSVERILYPQYFKNGDWPTDPITQAKLPIESYKS